MFVKKLGVHVDEGRFSPKYREKNLEFFKMLDDKEVDIYYYNNDPLSSCDYYDLVIVKVGTRLNALPAPLFYEWTGVKGYEITFRKLDENDYRQLREEIFLERLETLLEHFNPQVGKIAKRVIDGESLVLSYLTTLDGEKRWGKMLYYSPARTRFWIHYVNCLESAELNLGDCNCDHHRSTEIMDLSLEEALGLIQGYLTKSTTHPIESGVCD
jgi:hypothetical protein